MCSVFPFGELLLGPRCNLLGKQHALTGVIASCITSARGTLSISVAELDRPFIMMTTYLRTVFSSSPDTGGYILSSANTSEASMYTS